MKNDNHRLSRALRANLLTISTLFICAGLRVQADGGDGGSSNLTLTGGAGGTGTAGAPGGNGQIGDNYAGSGGGGGGAGGGAGGQGGAGLGGAAGGAGGAGGTAISHNGQNAPAAPTNTISHGGAGGGGGGGGGYNGNGAGAASIDNTISISGGNGGNGANGGTNGFINPLGGGGGGGAGGLGLIVTGSTTNTNTGKVSGGNGGKGGIGAGGADFGSAGGNGGDGGVGILLNASNATLTNSGTIRGGTGGAGGGAIPDGAGNGGAGGTGVLFNATGGTLVNSGAILGGNGGASSVAEAGVPGEAGVAIQGGGMTITNSGIIKGGLDGAGNQADAIQFTSGVNTLTLLAGSAITGNVVAFSNADSLTLGGSKNATLAVSPDGSTAQYQGFGAYQKVGTGVWTLTNTTTAVTPWTISGGTLAISQDASLGDDSGTLTLNGGTLETTAAFSSSRNINLLAGGGTLQTKADLTLSGTISNVGMLTKTGSGSLILNQVNTYSGGTAISSGVVEAESNNALGSGAVTVKPGASLELTGGITLPNAITIGGTGVRGAGAIFDTADPLNTSYFANTINGNLTLAGNASISLPTIPEVDLFLNGNVNLAGNELSLQDNNDRNEVVFTGQITGSGGITIENGGVGSMQGSTSNTYTGMTIVQAGSALGLSSSGTAIPGNLLVGGTVIDESSDQLAATTVVTLTGDGRFVLALRLVSVTAAGIVSTSSLTQFGPESDSGGGNSVTLDGTGTYSFAGHINNARASANGVADGGAVAVIKQGSGTQEFNGASNYSGGTTLEDGTLIAGNAEAFGIGPMTVGGGTLTVGNNNHVLSVGNYAQTGGTLLLNVTGRGPAATADQLHVANTTGNPAVLGGNLTVNLGGLVPALGPATTYTFNLVDTDAGYTGAFAFNPLNLSSGLTASLDYAGDDVLLQIGQGAHIFSVTGLTPNQQAIVGPINTALLAGNRSSSFTALTTALAPFDNNPGALGAALNELSPQAFGQFTSETAFNNASFETQGLDNYLASQRGGLNGTFIGGNGSIDASGLTLDDSSYDPTLAMVHSRLLAWNAAPVANGLLSDGPGPVLGGVEMKDTKAMAVPAAGDPWNFFVSGNVILAQGFSDPDVSHYDDNTESVALGADYRITPNFLVGLTAGYGHTDVTLDDNGSSATVDSYSPGIYASYAEKGWFANLSGDYIHNAYTQSRVIGILGQTATSAPEGNEGVANLDGGYDFHQGAFTLSPLAGLQYTHLTVDGYAESGSVADLGVNDQNADSLRSRLGGRISYALSRCGVNFTPHLDATWQHEFMDQSRGITSQFSGAGLGSFSVKTDNPSRDSALVDAGLDAEINRTVTVFADYEVQAGQENYFGQSVQAGVKIGF